MPAFEQEFITVDLILASDAETRGVDAFCLAWIKFERQLRKMTANTIYQASEFVEGDCEAIDQLRNALLAKNTSNYERFLDVIRRLSGQDLRRRLGQLVTAERCQYLWHSISVAHERRNKLLHGLQTGESLEREPLVKQVKDILEVCQLISNAGEQYLGYDGLSRDSLRKNGRPDITQCVDQATLVGGWRGFVAHRF